VTSQHNDRLHIGPNILRSNRTGPRECFSNYAKASVINLISELQKCKRRPIHFRNVDKSEHSLNIFIVMIFCSGLQGVTKRFYSNPEPGKLRQARNWLRDGRPGFDSRQSFVFFPKASSLVLGFPYPPFQRVRPLLGAKLLGCETDHLPFHSVGLPWL
jgi:hypothetical protein